MFEKFQRSLFRIKIDYILKCSPYYGIKLRYYLVFILFKLQAGLLRSSDLYSIVFGIGIYIKILSRLRIPLKQIRI